MIEIGINLMVTILGLGFFVAVIVGFIVIMRDQ